MFKIPIPLKAIPMVLDDSFTPAELLTKMTFKINEIIEETNTLQTDKVDIDQGIEKAGYFLKVNAEGKVVAIESGGVMANWGDIAGAIENQTDLINLINNGLNLKLDKNDVENSLISDSITKALSAYQGKVLKQFIDAINNSKISVSQGTENAGKFLRVDTYGNVIPMDSSGGSINWGDIIGNIAQQADLMQMFSNITNIIGNWTSALGADIATEISNLQNAVRFITNIIGTWTSALGADIATAISNLQNAVKAINQITSNILATNEYSNGTFTIFNQELLCATITYNGTKLAYNIILPKQIKDTKTITINSYNIYVRDDDGYIKTNAGADISGLSKQQIDELTTDTSVSHYGQILSIVHTFSQQLKKTNGDLISISKGAMVAVSSFNITIS